MAVFGKPLLALLGFFLAAQVGFACELVGSYVIHWTETHGDTPGRKFQFEIVRAGAEPRPTLEGVQAKAAIDCRIDIAGDRSRYLLAFERDAYLKLGWDTGKASAQLSCYWNDMFLMCRNRTSQAVSFECPSALDRVELSDEAHMICSVRRTEREHYSKKRVTYSSSTEYFGAAAYSGIFSLERVKK